MTKKVLIADDEAMIRDLVRLSLQSEGYEIHEVEDGPSAVRVAKQIKPDLMILDVMLPGIIGYRVCSMLKEEPDTNKIYIMFITSRSGTQVETTINMCNGDEVVFKPFDPEELKQKVIKALARIA